MNLNCEFLVVFRALNDCFTRNCSWPIFLHKTPWFKYNCTRNKKSSRDRCPCLRRNIHLCPKLGPIWGQCRQIWGKNLRLIWRAESCLWCRNCWSSLAKTSSTAKQQRAPQQLSWNGTSHHLYKLLHAQCTKAPCIHLSNKSNPSWYVSSSYICLVIGKTHSAVMMGLHRTHNFGSSASVLQCLETNFQGTVQSKHYWRTTTR